jgi:transposase-like protein
VGKTHGRRGYIWLDATYVKARRDGRIVSVAVIVAVGVNDDGRREEFGSTRRGLCRRQTGNLRHR